jgi:4-amino-4-deoxy-L-arabinose transferase-like glycosyltransferase
MMKLSAIRRKTLSRLGLRRSYALDLPLVAALLVGLALRLLLWDHIPRTGLISDEGEYLSAASWLAHGHSFDWYQGYLWTRAPLYPLFLAAHLRLFGDSLTPIYITQTLLSLINIALVYFLARQLIDQRPTTNDQRDREPQNRGTAEPQNRRTENREPPKRYPTENQNLHPPSSIPHPLFCIPSLAALLMALYLPFALYPQTLLSETLFICLLLGGFLALARWANDHRSLTTDQRPTTNDQQGERESGRAICSLSPCLLVSLSVVPSFVVRRSSFVALLVWLASAGILFGLATLTRSITLLFLPIVAIWIFIRRSTHAPRITHHAPRHRLLAALVFLACAGAIILPWTIYNSRIYGGPVLLDTSGAFNLLLGGRTAYDGKRQDAPPRNFVLALLDSRLKPEERRALVADACLTRHNDQQLSDALARPVGAISQSERQQLMTAEGLCLIEARPVAFLIKSVGELADLFQINYSGDERFADGYTTGRLPPWYTLSLFLLDDTLYVLALPLAVIGWALKLKFENGKLKKPGQSKVQFSILNSQFSILIGLWWLYNILLAPLLFAINRFRLPLLPFAFIFAAYALFALFRGEWAALRSRAGLMWGALALALAVLATTPYAYLWSYAGSADPALTPSYLGPDPSSLASTWRALESRPRYLATEQLRLALRNGDLLAADSIIGAGALDPRIATLGRALLAGRRGHYDEGLSLLPADDTIAADRPYRVLVSVVRGDLLRSAGRQTDARMAFGGSDQTRFVDDANPVQWAWDWLHPAPLIDNRIDLAGDLDLGYIEGCYLGEGDPEASGTFRWCTDGVRLRFPGAGTGAPQTLALRADGRGWLAGWLPVPSVQVLLSDQEAGTFTPNHADVRDFAVALPASPPGADVVVTLRTPTFVPDAARYLSQQGEQVGQIQRLGIRLDWAELRN